MASSDSLLGFSGGLEWHILLISCVGHWLQAPLSWFMKNQNIPIMCKERKLRLIEKMNRIVWLYLLVEHFEELQLKQRLGSDLSQVEQEEMDRIVLILDRTF